MNPREDRVSELLSAQFPTIAAAAAEIINLNAILGLPKGTEHFLSDLHGEDEAFCRLIKNASGEIRFKMKEVFSGILSEGEQDELAELIYEPKKIQSQKKPSAKWYREKLSYLIQLCRALADKYTRSKVRKALPKDFAYILEELLHVSAQTPNRKEYHQGILSAIIEEGQAESFFICLCELMGRLAVDRLHILGDIFDRGDGPHRILDILMHYHSVDLCWGNHDILWMGANLGNPLAVAEAVRISLRYNHSDLLEQGYSIPLRNLFSLGEQLYREDECSCFLPRGEHSVNPLLVAKAHKAIAVILWKLEISFYKTHPQYDMASSCTLNQIDFSEKTVMVDGFSYPLLDAYFPTVNPEKPWELTAFEEEVLKELCRSFSQSEKLSSHVGFLIEKGRMYQVTNGNLLYHGCVPLTEDGNFATFLGYRGRALMDFCDTMVRNAYFSEKNHPQKQMFTDFFWYLWAGKHSPLFGKTELRTLPRYLIADKSTHRETKNPYYQLIEGENGKQIVRAILSDFSLYHETARVINGHVPVRQNRGETPVKAEGILYMIDGGLSSAYRETTGIGGYTLLYNSHGFFLTAHTPTSHQATEKLSFHRVMGEPREQRIRVSDTDTGKILRRRIRELRRLVAHYQRGTIPVPPEGFHSSLNFKKIE